MGNWDPKTVFVDGRYVSKDTWLDGGGKPFQPQVHYFVGGATKLYGAALYRLRPQDFGETKHVDGISPAWPLACLVHAKADAEVIAVRPILGQPNVTLLTGAEVTRLETDGPGRTVTGAAVTRDGRQEVYRGDLVAVCAGAANSAKILLNSASDRHPNGLANASDQVGRNYMFHNCKAVVALSKEPNDTVFQKTLGINDFYFATQDYEWPMGNIQIIGKSNAEAMRGEKPKLTKLSPEWTLTDVAGHAVDFWLTTEDLPKPENRVTTDKDGNVHLAYVMTNNDEAFRLYGELRKILNQTGMTEHHVLRKNFYMDMDIPVAGCAHQVGTCRFGTDPATSVLDTDCKAHELDNLYVVDTSFFPSIGAVNPALTAIANALRVGEHLLSRMA